MASDYLNREILYAYKIVLVTPLDFIPYTFYMHHNIYEIEVQRHT